MMDSYGTVSALLSFTMLFLRCCLARLSDTIDMSLQEECNGDARTVSGAVVFFEPSATERWHGVDCRIIFKADQSFNRLQLRVLHVDLPDVTLSRLCNDALYIFDGHKAYGNTFKQTGGMEGLCGSSQQQQQQQSKELHQQELMFQQQRHLIVQSTGSFLTVHLRTDRSGLRGRGVRFVVTAFVEDKKMALCVQNSFRCNNTKCVDRDLTCDGVDHCADESDESQHSPAYCTPPDEGASLLTKFFSIGVTAAVAIVIGSLIVGLGFVFSLVYCFCRPRGEGVKRRRDITMASATASVLINNGSHSNLSFGVSPPPYHASSARHGYYQLQSLHGTSPGCTHSQVSYQSCTNSFHQQQIAPRTPSSTRSMRSQNSGSVRFSNQRQRSALPVAPPVLPDWADKSPLTSPQLSAC